MSMIGGQQEAEAGRGRQPERANSQQRVQKSDGSDWEPVRANLDRGLGNVRGCSDNSECGIFQAGHLCLCLHLLRHDAPYASTYLTCRLDACSGPRSPYRYLHVRNTIKKALNSSYTISSIVPANDERHPQRNSRRLSRQSMLPTSR